MANLNRSIVISRIPEFHDKNDLLKITDYVYDENKIGVNAIYQNKEYQLELLSEMLNPDDYPNCFGRRYFKIHEKVFFLDEASDTTGAF